MFILEKHLFKNLNFLYECFTHYPLKEFIPIYYFIYIIVNPYNNYYLIIIIILNLQ